MRDKKKSKKLSSSLSLIEAERSADYEYVFFINLTEETLEELLEIAENSEPDERGHIVTLGGALYESDSGKVVLRGTVYPREPDEKPKKSSSSKRRNNDDDDDSDDEPTPKSSRRRRSEPEEAPKSSRRSRRTMR